MVILFTGSDTIKVRSEALKTVAKFEDAGSRVDRVSEVRFNSGLLTEIAGSVSLFGEKTVFVLDTPKDSSEFFDELIKFLPDLVMSTNTVVIIENTLTALYKKSFEKADVLINEYNQLATKSKYDPFLMATALLNKDKKSLWLLLANSRREGVSAEETIGILWWQLKTLRVVAKTKSATEADMKPYTYDKSKRALGNFKSGELENLSRTLLRIYHDGHGGVKDINLGLEEWVLRV